MMRLILGWLGHDKKTSRALAKADDTSINSKSPLLSRKCGVVEGLMSQMKTVNLKGTEVCCVDRVPYVRRANVLLQQCTVIPKDDPDPLINKECFGYQFETGNRLVQV
jgi:hypothetical protein